MSSKKRLPTPYDLFREELLELHKQGKIEETQKMKVTKNIQTEPIKIKGKN